MLNQEFLLWFLNWAVTIFLIYMVFQAVFFIFIIPLLLLEKFSKKEVK